MAAKPTGGPPPYGFSPEFEQALALRLCTSQKLYALIGHKIAPGRLVAFDSRLAVEGARLVHLDTGRGPTSPATVLERLRQEVLAGKRAHEELQAVEDFFLDAPPLNTLPGIDEVVALVRPIIAREMQQEAVRESMSEYARGGDFERIEKTLREARRFGHVESARGLRMGADSFAAIRQRRQSARLPTPIMELTAQLNGGLMRGKAGMIGAGGKVGKSMYLVAQNATSLLRGHFVLHATLELPEIDTNARQMAYLTGVPIDAILDGTMEAECARRMEYLEPYLGIFKVRFFPAKATTMHDIVAWVTEEEEKEGRKVDLLTLDYIDKMGASDRKLVGEYAIQGAAAEEYRIFVHDRSMYGWTATQGRRRDRVDRGKRLELDDIADSQNKIRVMDLVLTAHKPTPEEIEYFVAGNRDGPDGFSVGPFPHDYACARILTPYDIPPIPPP